MWHLDGQQSTLEILSSSPFCPFARTLVQHSCFQASPLAHTASALYSACSLLKCHCVLVSLGVWGGGSSAGQPCQGSAVINLQLGGFVPWWGQLVPSELHSLEVIPFPQAAAWQSWLRCSSAVQQSLHGSCRGDAVPPS